MPQELETLKNADAKRGTPAYRPEILGVLNLSLDSTTRVSVAAGRDEMLERARVLKAAGATWIDVGARSTWQFAERFSDEIECERLVPNVRLLKGHSYRVSVDTWSPATAVATVEAGADMINYTGSQFPDEMLQAIERHEAALAVSYMPFNDPYHMRDSGPLPCGWPSILSYFDRVLRVIRRFGIAPVILDPNIGIMHQSIDGMEKVFRQAAVITQIERLERFGCPTMIHSPRQDDANGRAIFAAFILNKRPHYIRTHYPELMRELLEYDDAH
jgi:dihydropteroate synthase